VEHCIANIPDVLWYALIISFFSTVSPLLLAYMTNRHTRADRAADWERQDKVARKAAEAADLLITSNARMAAKASEAAQLLVIDNKKVAYNAALTLNKLDAVHTLVNSGMTAAIQSELEAVERELILLREVSALRRASGGAIDPDTAAAIEVTKVKIAELTISLADRKAATKTAEAELAKPVTTA
jgi:ATP-dependent Lon protease